MLRWRCHSCYHQEHQDIRHSEGRVQCLANITRIYAKWNASMQCLHRVGLSLSRCAAGKPMLGTTERTRGTPATKSNPIDEVWSEIHARTVQSANNKSATAEPLQESEQGAACPPAISPKTSARPVYEHTCPFCNDTARSTVLSVPVDHRSACRHQFCGHAGSVSRFSSRAYEHACCACGTIARRRTNSNKAQDPAGKTCRRKSWQSLVSLVACATQSESKLQPPGA